MLARIAHSLYWLGRNLARAEFTARAVEAVFRAELEARVTRHLDYFGTEVLEFGIPTGHEKLMIDVRARVVTTDAPKPPAGRWESLASSSYIDAAGEFSLPWEDQPAIAGLDELERSIERATPLDTLLALCQLIPERFEYRPGATYVGSSVGHLLEVGAGVCQDFVHLGLILLRRAGIAARYVSGYLWAAPEDRGADSLEVDTHAWLEALLPGSDGRGEPVWVGADPTNRGLAADTHVKIGHGRFYSDVAPVKGLYLGGATSDVLASVTMTRLDPQARARA
jgi:transglutaminase-like putative cysteine protease